MDILQLSIVRAGGTYVDPIAQGHWEKRRQTATRLLSARDSQRSDRSKAITRSVGGLLLAMGHGLSALGFALQHRTQESAANTSFDSCGATSAAAH